MFLSVWLSQKKTEKVVIKWQIFRIWFYSLALTNPPRMLHNPSKTALY